MTVVAFSFEEIREKTELIKFTGLVWDILWDSRPSRAWTKELLSFSGSLLKVYPMKLTFYVNIR